MTIAEKLTAIAENEQKVFEAGKKAEYDAFWGAYQNEGRRRDYYCGFTGTGWTNETFKPKYDMKPTNAYQMFRSAHVSKDLVDDFEVDVDFSECTNMQYVFMFSWFSRVGVVDTRLAASLQGLFQNNTYTKTVDKLVLKTEGTQTFLNAFSGSTALESITIEGAIGNNIDFSACSKLTHDSLMSIINHLQTKASGSFVLTLGTTNLGKLSDAEKAIATERGWTLA